MSHRSFFFQPGTDDTDSSHSSQYNREVLYLSRKLTLIGQGAKPLLQLLGYKKPEPTDLRTFRKAAASDEVARVISAADSSKTLRNLPGVSVKTAMGLTWRARLASTSSEPKEALELLDLARDSCLFLPKNIGSWFCPDFLAVIEMARANVFRREERFSESEEGFRRSYCLHQRGSCQPALVADYLSFWSSLLLDLGSLGQAQTALSVAYVLSEADTECRGEVACLTGLLRQVQGKPQEAKQCFQEAKESLSDINFQRYLSLNLALATAEAGDCREAERLLMEFHPSDSDSAFLRALALRIKGLVHRSLGAEDVALSLFTHSAAAFEKCGDSQGFALSTLDAARLLLDRGEFQRVAMLAKGSMDVLSMLGVKGQALVAWMTFRQAAEAESLRSSAIAGFRKSFLELLLKSKFQATD